MIFGSNSILIEFVLVGCVCKRPVHVPGNTSNVYEIWHGYLSCGDETWTAAAQGPISIRISPSETIAPESLLIMCYLQGFWVARK